MEPNNSSIESSEQCIPRIKKALEVVELALKISTGHNEYQRRKIAYYAVATHFIKDFDPFPSFVIYGPPSTGKTMTLNVLNGTCYNPIPVTGETISAAALKACMRDANDGTLIIEEADRVTSHELESILITRYSTSSADNKKMVPDGHKGWELADYATFGATVAHRRNLFRDAALLRRVITVPSKRIKGDYIQITTKSQPALFKEFHQQLKWHPKLPKAVNEWDIEPGVFDCYKPLVSLVIFVSDTDFLNKLVEEMKEASGHLREEETYLEPQMLLRALIGLAYNVVGDKITPNRISIEINKINPALKTEFGPNCSVFQLSPNQRNRILRDDLGFTVKSAHSRQRIYLTIPQLILACEQNSIEDECLDEWRKALGFDGDSQQNDQEQTGSDWELET
jgi:hypothetical protein